MNVLLRKAQRGWMGLTDHIHDRKVLLSTQAWGGPETGYHPTTMLRPAWLNQSNGLVSICMPVSTSLINAARTCLKLMAAST